jgi:hypothetical protein
MLAQQPRGLFGSGRRLPMRAGLVEGDGIMPVDLPPSMRAALRNTPGVRQDPNEPPPDMGDWTPGERNPMTGQVNQASPRPEVAGPDEQPSVPAVRPRPSGLFGQGPASQPLGHSLREPFDYDSALRDMLPKKRSDLEKIGAIAVPVLMALSGNPEGASDFTRQYGAKRLAQAKQKQDAIETVLGWKHQDWSRQNGADLDASAPFTIGRNRLQWNPATGHTEKLYEGSADFEDYADSMGLKPGTDAYFRAVEDYVLRSNGPSAFNRDVQLDDHRTGNRRSLEGMRQTNRLGLEDRRQGHRIEAKGAPTYRDTHAPPPSLAGSAGGGRRASGPVDVSTPAEAAKLPPGTVYRTPDGRVKRR